MVMPKRRWSTLSKKLRYTLHDALIRQKRDSLEEAVPTRTSLNEGRRADKLGEEEDEEDHLDSVTSFVGARKRGEGDEDSQPPNAFLQYRSLGQRVLVRRL